MPTKHHPFAGLYVETGNVPPTKTGLRGYPRLAPWARPGGQIFGRGVSFTFRRFQVAFAGGVKMDRMHAGVLSFALGGKEAAPQFGAVRVCNLPREFTNSHLRKATAMTKSIQDRIGSGTPRVPSGDLRRHVPRTKNRRRSSQRLQLEPLEPRHLLSGMPELLADVTPGSAGSLIDTFTEVGTEVFFAHHRDLWKSTGTPPSTAKLLTVTHSNLSEHAEILDLVNVNGILAFSVYDDKGTLEDTTDDVVQLWKSNGTVGGTVLVKDFVAGSRPSTAGDAQLTALGDRVFGVFRIPGTQSELWVSDLDQANPAGTYLLRAFDVDVMGSGPRDLLAFDGKLYFAADDGTRGTELWRSDGTVNGTQIVKDIKSLPAPAGNVGSFPRSLTAGNGVFFFGVLDIAFSNDRSNDRIELYRSDGTLGNAVKLFTFPKGASPPGGMYGDPQLTYVPETGKLFGIIEYDDGAERSRDLVCWNGSTMQRWNLNVGGNDWVGNLSPVAGLLGFAADDGVHGREPWLTDGNLANPLGTFMIKDINPGVGAGIGSEEIEQGAFPTLDGLMYFPANDGVHGEELWQSDGTAGGTELVRDIYPGDGLSGPRSSAPYHLTGALDKLFFVADDGIHGEEPRVFDPDAPLELDFGDAPDPSYPTLLANDGARHIIEPGFHLGATIDFELDGQPEVYAMGDDNDGNQDDDGVIFVQSFYPGQPTEIRVDFTDAWGSGGKLDAWIDWNQDGDWTDAGDQVFSSQTVSAGSNTLFISTPASATVGYTVARFRLSRAGGLEPHGLANEGEVEDYMILVKDLNGMDFGDAPDPYPTYSGVIGAVHGRGDAGLYLGTLIDWEYDGQPDDQAEGDDNNNLADEDGVELLTPLAPGRNVQFRVTASKAGILNAWLDINADGDWDDLGEHFVVDQPLTPGANDLTRLLPADAVVTDSTFARFRFSSQAGLDYRGWAPDGEVEDYQVAIHAVRQWVVDSTGDGGDANIGDGICDDGSGACTLRAAIQEANALANLPSGSDGIVFAIPGPGTHPIQPASALPAITDSVVIDATTQPGYAGTPLIELDGSLAGAGVSGLRFETGGNTVKGLAINRFAASGILVLTGGENTIQGNFLGTDATGTAAAPNAASGIDVRTAGNLIGGAGSGEGNLISGNANFGILLLGGAAENTIVANRIGTDQTGTAAIGNALYGIYVTSPGNQIGGPAAGDGNLISGNLRGGVAITGATATGNVVQGNRTGTTADGHAALPNGNAGITVSNVSGNTIGGTAAGAGNVLSGNALHGAMIVGAASTNNVVQGNLVGLNAAGTAAVPNGQYGITNYSPTSMIGGPAAGAGNTVSGNNYSGVLVYTPTATEVKVQGNRIGTNAAGTAAVPNGFYGVYVNSTDNLIGGAAAGEGNLISGNTRGGVALTERTAQRNVVQGNRIGTNPAGTAALANGGSGVTIAEGSNNTIGGTAAGAGNQISGNAAQGVIVVGVNATGNTVRGNLIGTNGAGTAAVANGQYGVAVYSSNTTIGGAGSGNTISGNASGGVIVYGTTVTGTTVQGNRIGTDSTGSLAVANGGHGVFVVASNSLIGGSATGEGNVIGWNASSGVYVAGATSAGNAIRQNSIYRNGFWGIDLAPWGPTANDPEDADTGANNGQNFPELASAVLSGGTLNITYSVPSSTANSAYPLAVEFFLADADGQEGQTYLGGESYPAPGSDSVALTVSGLSAGQRVVATATDANGNTSEFSSSIIVAEALLASSAADLEASSATALDETALATVVWQAVAAWESLGLDAARVAMLQSLSFEIADLPGRYLGWATPDRIVLDIDAAGYGWYIAGDEGRVSDEFEISDSRTQMDLLTAVLHEMGHLLGLADLDEEDALMSGILQPGTRQLPTADDIDRILAGGDWLD
jgi:CSLREA domain-containing protein